MVNTSPVNSGHDSSRVKDEIDLRDLVSIVWSGKVTIVLFMLLGMVSTLSYALLAQEWWTSHAMISAPLPQDIAAYREQVKQFQPVFDVYQDDGTVLVNNELNELVDPKLLFKRFVTGFNSTNNKSDFLDTSVQFQTFKVDLEHQDLDELSLEDELRKLYADWFEKINALPIDPDDLNLPYELTFQSTTKSSSYELLKHYLGLIEQRENMDALDNLLAIIKVKKRELTQQKEILETQAQGKLAIETERAKYALDIAKAAHVDKPILSGNNSDELFDIDLGTKALGEKVKVLKEMKNLSVVEPRLEQINAKLKMLETLEIDRNVKFQTYRLLENVEQPVARDKPQRVLIVILGTVFGIICGTFIVLVRYAFRVRD